MKRTPRFTQLNLADLSDGLAVEHATAPQSAVVENALPRLKRTSSFSRSLADMADKASSEVVTGIDGGCGGVVSGASHAVRFILAPQQENFEAWLMHLPKDLFFLFNQLHKQIAEIAEAPRYFDNVAKNYMAAADHILFKSPKLRQTLNDSYVRRGLACLAENYVRFSDKTEFSPVLRPD